MDSRQQHNNLGFVFSARGSGCLICEGCNHIVFSAFLRSRVTRIYGELCIHSGKQFPRLLYRRREKSRWAILPYLLTPATCEVSKHSRFLIGRFERAAQLNTRAQRAAAGDGFMLADLLRLQKGKKKSETVFNTSPFYGRWIQSCDLPRSQRQEEGKENETGGNDGIVMETCWHGSVFLQVLTLQFYPEGMCRDWGPPPLTHTHWQRCGTGCINMLTIFWMIHEKQNTSTGILRSADHLTHCLKSRGRMMG